MLQEILKELETPDGHGASIPESQVQRWMKSEDTDILGATYAFLSDAVQVQRVTPSLSFDPVFDFMLRYYEFCFKRNPESKWANSAYSAGYDLVGWFVWMWDEQRDMKYFEAIKSRLAELYISGVKEMHRTRRHRTLVRAEAHSKVLWRLAGQPAASTSIRGGNVVGKWRRHEPPNRETAGSEVVLR